MVNQWRLLLFPRAFPSGTAGLIGRRRDVPSPPDPLLSIQRLVPGKNTRGTLRLLV